MTSLVCGLSFWPSWCFGGFLGMHVYMWLPHGYVRIVLFSGMWGSGCKETSGDHDVCHLGSTSICCYSGKRIFFICKLFLNCCPGYYRYAQNHGSFSPCLVWGVNGHQSKGPKHFNTELFNHAWSKTTAMWLNILLALKIAEQSMVCAVTC